jgi:cell division control protein 6
MDQNLELDEIFSRFHKPVTPIFKERESLRATFVPDNLPHRNTEIRSLANILGPIMAGGTPSNAFLYGKTGGGKTVVSKYVIEHLKGKAKDVGINFDYAFINCQLIDTSYRLYAFLCDIVGKDVPKTGLATNDIFDTFVVGLEERKIHLTIVLDEIDLLLRKAGEPLYILTRINSDLKNSTISIIGITNRIDFKESIDARIRSTLTEQEIIFPPYTANQLQDILTERSRTGFVDDVVEKGAISRASALAASEHGDARRALDLLRVAGEVAESSQDKKVTADHVKQASEVIERKIVKEVLTSLPIHSQIVVLAITKLSFQFRKTNSKDPLVTGETYEEYVRICRRLNFDPLTQRRVGDLISELDLLGLISATVVSKGRYGRTRIIKLSVHGLEIRKGLEKNALISELLEAYLDPVFDF